MNKKADLAVEKVNKLNKGKDVKLADIKTISGTSPSIENQSGVKISITDLGN